LPSVEVRNNSSSIQQRDERTRVEKAGVGAIAREVYCASVGHHREDYSRGW
jgi:hypothetical protein